MPTTLLILIVTLCTIGSQLLLKRSVGDLSVVMRESGIGGFLLAAATSPGVIGALAIQGCGYIVWMFVLLRAQLSVAFAISGSFFYLLMAAASWLFFGERLSPLQWMGLLLISAGVLMVSQGMGAGR
jgi:multidrug transporter EmrE-like cation transporter